MAILLVASPISTVPSVTSAATASSTVTTVSQPECTSSSCYNPIEVLGGVYFTNLTAILSFNDFAGVKDTPAYPCHCAEGFSIQLNTNIYSGGAWEQIVETVATDNSNASDPGNSYANLAAPMLFLSGTEPTQGCTGGEWTLVGFGNWGCSIASGHSGPSIQIGRSYQISSNGLLVFSAVFEANSTVLLRESYIVDGKTTQTSRGYYWLPVNPYGQVTAVGATVVGPGGCSHATFSPGTNMTLLLMPETNLGRDYGINWKLGGIVPPTGESSNLGIANMWYTDSEQGQEFIAARVTAAPVTTTTSTATALSGGNGAPEVPEFPLPAAAVAAVTFFLLAVLRRSILSKRPSGS